MQEHCMYIIYILYVSNSQTLIYVISICRRLRKLLFVANICLGGRPPECIPQAEGVGTQQTRDSSFRSSTNINLHDSIVLCAVRSFVLLEECWDFCFTCFARADLKELCKGTLQSWTGLLPFNLNDPHPVTSPIRAASGQGATMDGQCSN